MSSKSPVGGRLIIDGGPERWVTHASWRAYGTLADVVPDPQDLADLALVAEASRKTSLLWLRLPGNATPRAAWHVWHDGAAYVVHGVDTNSDEQRLPGLDEAESVEVTARSKDTGGRVVVWTAHPVVIPPDDEAWEAAAQALAGERLNAGNAETLTLRWSQSAHIVRLEPVGGALEAPGRLSSDAHAAPPPPTPAITRGPLPFVVGGAARARRRRARERRE
jgi:hypothetical protein